MRVLTLFIFISSLGCSLVSQKEIESIGQENWMMGSSLKNIESVIFDEKRNVYYASCGKSYSVGFDGFISKISTSGKLLDLKWVDSLSRPTGMAINGDTLIVADVDKLLFINTPTGEVIKELKSPLKDVGLNDVAIGSQGEVFVSASFIHSIFKVESNQLNLWIQDENLLTWANGLYVDNEFLWVGGLHFNKINLLSMDISLIATIPEIHDFDGIVSDNEGGFFLSTVDNSALWHLNKNQEIRKISDSEDYFGDLTLANDAIVIARGNHSRQEYYVSKLELE